MPEKPNIFVSNGTCYLGPSLEAGGDMIPCGNDYFGHIACCQANDACLEGSTCFNLDYQVTYIAGCTDPKYQDESCPPKFEDRETPWMGLSYCNGTSDEWVICDQSAHPRTLTSPDPCYCPTATADRSMFIPQPSTILAIGMLPNHVGESIEFAIGHYPTARVPTTSIGPVTPTLSSSFLSTIFTPIPTATTEPFYSPEYPSPPQSNQGFNKAAKIGTAVGAAAFGLLALMAIGLFLLRRRRQKRAQQQQRQQEENAIRDLMNGGSDKPPADNVDPYNIGLAVGGPNEAPQLTNHHAHGVPELDAMAARPWSMRSELDPNSTVGSSSIRSEVMTGQGLRHVRAGPSELASRPLAELPG